MEVLSSSQVIRRIGITYNTLYKWIELGKIKAIKTPIGDLVHYGFTEGEVKRIENSMVKERGHGKSLLMKNNNNHTVQDRLIDSIYAFLSVDPKTGFEEIIGIGLEGITESPHMKAITSSMETIDRLKPIISKMAKTSGKTIKLVRFSTKEVLEEF